VVADWPKPNIPESDIDQGFQITVNGTDGFEKLGSLCNRHVQDIRNGFALVVNLEGLAVVSGAVTHLTVHVDVGEKVHLDGDGAIT
jgi:hypothetical protein